MKVISISKSKFEQLEPLKLSKATVNTEGHVYEFNYRGKPKVLKRLFHQSGAVFANKLFTLEMLDTYKDYLPDNFYIPDSLISVDSTIEGFTVPRIFGETLTDVLSSDDISSREKVYYLKKVGETLNQMSTIRKYTPLTELFLNDLHEANFMVNRNNKQLYVVDLDSCKISGNTAFQAKYLTPNALLQYTPSKYQINKDESIAGYVTADESSDLYCYNIMILNFLYGDNINNFTIPEFYSYLNYLHYIGINNELLEYFNRLATNNRNKNPFNCLDSLTDEQICRARKNVYTKIMKK